LFLAVSQHAPGELLAISFEVRASSLLRILLDQSACMAASPTGRPQQCD